MTNSEDDEFFAAVGRTFSAWSVLENLMYQWITHLLDGKQYATNDAILKEFNNDASFSAKKKLLNTVVLEMPDDAIKQFLNKALEKATHYAGFRNRLAHDLYVAKPIGGGHVMEIRKQKKLHAQDESITLEGLKAAQQRIGQLNLLLLQVKAKTKTPSEAMHELDQMPRIADLPVGTS